MAKKFINDASAVVEEMVQGVVAAHADTLVRLQGYHVLLHQDFEALKRNQVTLLSGGGSGHEPAHAGYIGTGMLTGAILGGVFASPSVASILAAIRAVGGAQGVLLVVKNYTGDRLNFGQAALMARSEGIPVEIVVVADDCALPEGKGITGGRGVAGTVFVHKIAGAAAEAGGSLAEVAAEARAAAEAVKSLGVALTTCTVPGGTPDTRLDGDAVELGLGIHGEPGIRKAPWAPADSLVDSMLGVILERARLAPGSQVALMVNNLGGTPTMELYILARRAIQRLSEEGLVVVRILVGPYMTSLEMQGASISVLPLNPLSLARLDSPTTSSAWSMSRGDLNRGVEAKPVGKPFETPSSEVEAVAGDGQEPVVPVARIIAVCEAIIAAEVQLTEWDKVAGDGDCGITFQRGADEVLRLCADFPLHSSALTFRAIAEAISRSMGGTSGALLEIFFRAAQVHLQDLPEDFAGAFCKGVDAIKEMGGADAGMRTMLDALLPAAACLRKDPSGLEAAVLAAQTGAESTKAMDALAGRSNYIPKDVLSSVPDPGAMAMAISLNALLVDAPGK
mmetsp:Transcript_22186/g.64401  ORF Transcript_22186/g.64401 Transcript_22186/m.64401 type:complete len:565 (-) Transcript_22186:139-1833(-)